MDRETIELIFRSNFNTVKDFVKLLVDPLRTEINKLKNDNEELKRSLEFAQAELDDVKKSVRDHSKQQQEVVISSVDHQELSDRVRSLEDYSRRNNVIIEGMAEQSDENSETLQVSVQNLLNDKLDMTPEIDVVHRVGRAVSERPRAVIVKLKTFKVRQECLKRSPRLKGTNIYINEDISKATHEIRKTKMKEMKEKRQQGLIAYFSGADLITKERGQSAPNTKRIDNKVREEKRMDKGRAASNVASSNKGTAPSYGEKLRARK